VKNLTSFCILVGERKFFVIKLLCRLPPRNHCTSNRGNIVEASEQPLW
jgi:hypothetical protein